MNSFFLDIDTLNFQKGEGLLTAVVQDEGSGTVLMVGYQNREAVGQTLESGLVTFYSRSKGRLWTKGESSANFLPVSEVRKDCDQDALLYLVKAPETTCHTGDFSCFGEPRSFGFLSELFALILDRQKNCPKGSYVSSLFEEGLDRITQKVGEEAIETVIAAKNEDQAAFLNESADLLFHWMVLCAEKGVDVGEVTEVLRERAK